ncbi:M3 family metallopeptidase [Acinetobacter gerneri]|uniref:oligopeptidase A n=1 Tax=Acinetobacter gerneri TaxID=202952 RepID=A0AAW8JD95_9GAMM|nr:M3 family metallopeptidase [Acinetobacter gerneri]MDQ9008388.1 M3 family metallopeptidase [Acinetobacter gerneri]MDQ9012647.1 M3 family metallopeptidase [Acinetobacter gerneri]MDQ9024082.1 M3 family metallopeptidase [Acinetobacter gerneri]MDQ9050956.1 M3 family metallopeptidase [Acinetobacter gerneri]MDQ9058542.1 M3 family metallopeptidase [Acinetobacter gerneri]
MTLEKATLPVPAFDQITLQDLKKQIENCISQGQSFLDQLTHVAVEAKEQLQVLEQVDHLENDLNEAWGVLSHLNAVMNNPETRELYQSLLPGLSEYYTQLGQHKVLFETYQNIADSQTMQSLSEAQQSAIRLALRDFKLSGVALEGEAQKRYAEISARLSELSSNFSNNVLDATQAFSKNLDQDQLKGLPESAVALLKQLGEQKGSDQAVATLDIPSYLAIMTYADDRQLRENLHTAYTTRASDQSDHPEFDNTPIMEEILALRQEMANLLGFSNFAEYSLASKMAPDVATVHQFLVDLAEHARQPALKEIEDLKAIAAKDEIQELRPWDTAYYSEKLKQQQFNLSQESLKPYFPAPKIIQGLFAIVKRLYGIQVIERQAPVWHPDAHYYEIEDHGQVIGGFYFDLYARSGKRGGAWMSGFRSRMQTTSGLQKPICYMVCNFTPPVGDQPALLTHDELVTIFHEFGHGLHHMLTEVDNIAVAGTHGVAWDAVELPSQFMEFWTWDKESLDCLSEHIETQAVLPNELLKALLDARFFQSGMHTLRQIEFAMFDLNIHKQTPALTAAQIQETLNDIRSHYSVSPTTPSNRFQNSFSHIFAGGYAAGYYSYKWAEVLANDAFDRFENEGIFNKETGQAFRDAILAVGGKDTALEAFVHFRGREPKIDALLRHQGWTNNTKSA